MANYNYGGNVAYNATTEDAIRRSFRASRHCKRKESYQVDFEHDNWYVTEMGTGKVFLAYKGGMHWEFDLQAHGD